MPARLVAAACASTRKPFEMLEVVKVEALEVNAANSCAIVAFGFASFTSAQKPFIAAFASDVPWLLTTVPPGLTAFHEPEVHSATREVAFE